MSISELVTKLRVYGPLGFYRGVIAEIKNNLKAFFRNTYSQGEEDLIIDKLLKYKQKGFYVDVGAYDPHRLSNTKRFYKKGWTGINIEPNIYGYRKFEKKRPKDINLNIGISNKNNTLTFYQFTPDTLSTFSENEANYYKGMGYKVEQTYKVPVVTLKKVLQKHAVNKKIDFLNVDAEGFDMEVLESNDWKNFRPTIICIEAFEHSLEDDKVALTDLEQFLVSQGYKKVSQNKINALFVDTGKGF